MKKTLALLLILFGIHSHSLQAMYTTTCKLCDTKVNCSTSKRALMVCLKNHQARQICKTKSLNNQKNKKLLETPQGIIKGKRTAPALYIPTNAITAENFIEKEFGIDLEAAPLFPTSPIISKMIKREEREKESYNNIIGAGLPALRDY